MHNQSGQSHISKSESEGIRIANVILDNYAVDNSIDRIDFMKMDIEGFELSGLKGAHRLLNENKIRAIYLELIPENLQRYNLYPFDVLSFLETKGYQLYFCKSSDFKYINRQPKTLHNLNLLYFKSHEYPKSLSSDILALPSQ